MKVGLFLEWAYSAAGINGTHLHPALALAHSTQVVLYYIGLLAPLHVAASAETSVPSLLSIRQQTTQPRAAVDRRVNAERVDRGIYGGHAAVASTRQK